MHISDIADPTAVVFAFQPQEMRRLDQLDQTLSAAGDPLVDMARMCVSPATADLCRRSRDDKALRRRAREALCADLNRIVEEGLLFKEDPEQEQGAPNEELGRLVERLGGDDVARQRGSIYTVVRAFRPHVDVQPYPGPNPFNQEDAFRFFGRRYKASEIVARVIANEAVLVSAPSGAGKTSLLNTTIVPQLEARGCRVLPPARFRGPQPEPGIRNPYMHQALLRWLTDDDTDKLGPDPSLVEFLQHRFPVSDEPADRSPIVLVFDQFEELFTFFPEFWHMREDVFHQFRDALQGNHLLRILMLVREDFAARVDRYAPLLPERLRMRIGLERLRQEAAIEAVERPLDRTWRRYADGVAESLVNQLLRVDGAPAGVFAEFVEPVQLQIVCRKLWSDLEPDVLEITDAHTSELADVLTALGEYYDETLAAVLAEEATPTIGTAADVDSVEADSFKADSIGTDSIKVNSIKEGELRTWFERHLITSSGTKGLVLEERETTGGMPNELVKSLEARYLLRSEPRGDRRLYELSHDRLVPAILEANARFRRKIADQAGERYTHLTKRARRWAEGGKPAAELLTADELTDAHHYLGTLDSQGIEPEESFAAFVADSERAEQARREQERVMRARLQRRLLFGTMTALTVVTILFVLVVVLFVQTRVANQELEQKGQELKLANATISEAKDEALHNLSSMLVSDGIAHLFQHDTPSALLLFQEAAKVVEKQADEQQAVEQQGDEQQADERLASNRRRMDVLWPRLPAPIEVFVQPGLKSAVLDDSGTTVLLDMGGAVEINRLDETGRLRKELTPLQPVEQGEDATRIHVSRTQWQPGGDRFVTLGRDQHDTLKIQVWSGDDARPLTGPLDAPAGTQQFGITRDGNWVFASNARAVQLRDVSSPGSLASEIEVGADSDAGKANIEVVAVAQPFAGGPGKSPQVFIGRDDGRSFLHADGNATTLELADTEVASESEPAHRPMMVHATSAAFSPDGKLLAVGCSDGRLRLWLVDRLQQQPRPLVLFTQELTANALSRVVFSPDGRKVAAVSSDVALVWDLASRRNASQGDNLLAAINQSVSGLQHGALIFDLCFDPRGVLVATAGRDRTARVWRIVAGGFGQPVSAPLYHPGSVSNCQFLPDGNRLFTGNSRSGAGDGYAAIWKLPDYRHWQDDLHLAGRVGRDAHHLTAPGVVVTARSEPDRGDDAPTAHVVAIGGESEEPTTRDRLSLPAARYASLSPSGEHVIVVRDGRAVQVYETLGSRTTPVAILPQTESAARAFCSSRQRLALTISTDGGDSELGFYRWSETGRQLAATVASFSLPEEVVVSATFSPSGKFAVVATTVAPSSRSRAHLFEIGPESPNDAGMVSAFAPVEHEQTILHAAFNSDESLLATTSLYDDAKVWRIGASLAPLCSISHTADVYFALFARGRDDRDLLVTCSDDNTARVWDAATGDARTNELLHDGYVRHAAVSPDGLLVTASLDGKARIWSLESGEFIGMLNHGGPVHYVAIDNDRVTTVSSDDPGFTEAFADDPQTGMMGQRPGGVVHQWTLDGRREPRLADPELEKEYLELLAARRITADDRSFVRLNTDGLLARWKEVRPQLAARPTGSVGAPDEAARLPAAVAAAEWDREAWAAAVAAELKPMPRRPRPAPPTVTPKSFENSVVEVNDPEALKKKLLELAKVNRTLSTQNAQMAEQLRRVERENSQIQRFQFSPSFAPKIYPAPSMPRR